MTLSCFIIDDEPLALGLIESYVRKTPFLALAGKYYSAAEASGAAPGTGVLEVGPGIGPLTRQLARRADIPPDLPANAVTKVQRRRLLETLKAFFLDLGFAGLTFSTPAEHDRIIAFTSQLAHIVSSAYVKSPEAQRRRGFSAGSFQDMTRVARLDEDMWTELFLDDEDFLTRELDELIGHLTDYRDALRAKDARRLHDLLKEGRELKATAGGN